VGSISYSDYYGDNGYFKKYLNPLRQASIHIFNMGVPNNSDSRKEGYLHSKVIVIDESEVWIGSTNGSYGSTNINREYGIILKDPAQAKQMIKMLDFDFKAGMDLNTHVPPPDANGKQANLVAGSCKIKAQSSTKPKNEESEDI
jgi:phosphatidylserine/phosphatidylglycerophosphate/cardiolipin synthase-like enzyme